MPGQRTLLRIGPAARRIGFTAKRLRALANSGQIPVHRRAKGRERLFDPADVDRMKARLDEQAAPEPFPTGTDAKKHRRYTQCTFTGTST